MAALPRFPAVRTAAGTIQADIGRGAVELDETEAVDVALSLLASTQLPPYLAVLMRDFAAAAQCWLNEHQADTADRERYLDFAERVKAVSPPPTVL